MYRATPLAMAADECKLVNHAIGHCLTARRFNPGERMRTHDAAVLAAAERIRTAFETGQPTAPVRDQLPAGDVAAAYAVQKLNTDHWLDERRRLVGRKIGLTSKVVQKQLGVESPDFGMLFADMALADGEEVALGRVMQPKVEAEVALVMQSDLAMPEPTLTELISAVAYQAVEIPLPNALELREY